MDIAPYLSQDFLTVADDAPLSELIGKLKQYEKHSVLVFRQGKYLGMIEKKKVLRSRLDATEVRLKSLLQKAPLISEHDDIISVAYLMYQSNADFVPVQKDKKIIGVLRSLDLVKAAAELPEAKGLTLDDFKLIKPRRMSKDAPLATAMELMHDESLDQLPLFEKEKLYGIISYKDIIRKYLNWSPRRDYSAKFNKTVSSKAGEGDLPRLGLLPASSFSTNDNLVMLAPQASMKEAAALMAKNNILDVLVVSRDEFKGMLTVKNMLRRIGSLKIPQNYNIQFIGLNQVRLEPYQKQNVQKICSNEAFKIQRLIHNDFTLVVHLKDYGKEGKQRKYSVHLRVEYPGHIITAAQDDWDIETALHKTFDNAQNEAKKKFQGDTSKRFMRKGRM